MPFALVITVVIHLREHMSQLQQFGLVAISSLVLGAVMAARMVQAKVASPQLVRVFRGERRR